MSKLIRPPPDLSSWVDLLLGLFAALQLLWNLAGRHFGSLQGVYQLHIIQQRAAGFVQQPGGIKQT